MILKFRTGMDEHLSWRIVSGINRIDYRYIDKPCFSEDDDYINVFRDIEDARFAEIFIMYDNGERETVFTDDVVYILNDNGKTCDSIFN